MPGWLLCLWLLYFVIGYNVIPFLFFLPICEHEMSLHLFRSLFQQCFAVFNLYLFAFIKCIPKYYILYGNIILVHVTGGLMHDIHARWGVRVGGDSLNSACRGCSSVGLGPHPTVVPQWHSCYRSTLTLRGQLLC